MKQFPEYASWAKDKLDKDACQEDWYGLSLSEASARALALCNEAKDGTTGSPILAFYHLEQFAKAINDKYPPIGFRSYWRRW